MRDMHGLTESTRVVAANSETTERGTIEQINDDGTITVRWDNGRRTDVDVDDVIPEGGW